MRKKFGYALLVVVSAAAAIAIAPAAAADTPPGGGCGGIMCLTANGAQDVYLTGPPQIQLPPSSVPDSAQDVYTP